MHASRSATRAPTTTLERERTKTNRYITRGLGQYCDASIADTYPWPTCALHLSLVTEYPDWYGWVCESQHAPHGYVHVWIGGMLNCDETMTNLSELVGKENADLLKLNSMNRKSYWQEGYFECQGHAEIDVSVGEVRLCVCVFRDPCFQAVYGSADPDQGEMGGSFAQATPRRLLSFLPVNCHPHPPTPTSYGLCLKLGGGEHAGT